MCCLGWFSRGVEVVQRVRFARRRGPRCFGAAAALKSQRLGVPNRVLIDAARSFAAEWSVVGVGNLAPRQARLDTLGRIRLQAAVDC